MHLADFRQFCILPVGNAFMPKVCSFHRHGRRVANGLLYCEKFQYSSPPRYRTFTQYTIDKAPAIRYFCSLVVVVRAQAIQL